MRVNDAVEQSGTCPCTCLAVKKVCVFGFNDKLMLTT